MVKLRLTREIQNLWMERDISATIPRLASVRCPPMPLRIEVDIEIDIEMVKEIADDCRHMVDPNGPDMTIGERSAYRGLLRQCEAALAAH